MILKEFLDKLKKDKLSWSRGESGSEDPLDPDYLLKVGVQYKSLTRAEKNSFTWNDLLNALDIKDWNGHAYRCWVYQRTKNQQNAPKVLPNIQGNNLAFDPQHYEKTSQLRDYWRAIRSEKRDEARVDEIKETIISAAKNLSSFLIKDYIHKEADREPLDDLKSAKESVLLLSDLHLGIEYHSDYNNYDAAIAAGRLGLLASETRRYCIANDVKVLNILNLGDMIQGIIHTSSRLYAQFDAVTQTMMAAEMIANFLSLLQDAAPYVTYRSCTDNHSRLIANKNECIEDENLYRIIDWWLEERLKNSNIHFKDDNVDQGLGRFNLQNGKKVMFAHGHQDPDSQVFQHFIGATQEFIDYGFISHEHSYKTKDYQNMTVIVNGSIVGTEQYSNSLRLYNKPSQTLLIFDGPNLITHRIDLSSIQK